MEKSNPERSPLHLRNKHRGRYDFPALIAISPQLKDFVFVNPYGNDTVDFANPLAVKALNKALLHFFYQIEHWDIPEGYLCPPIPGRADYLHYAADLLASTNQQVIPKGKKIKVLDIGVGANCIYPIIGQREYGWIFVGSDIDQQAVHNAQNIVDVNPLLKNKIEIRHQKAANSIFNSIIHHQERFDLTVCNPPFHASADEALAGSERKVRNLGRKNHNAPILNFGGKNSELWTEGGELGFIEKMINESKAFRHQCFWFTTLVSKSENLNAISVMLKRADVFDMRSSEMTTGNKITRIIAWTFLDEKEQDDWGRVEQGIKKKE